MINVTIVGFGNVGSSLALLLLNNKQQIRLNIMDPDKQREGAYLDLAHCMNLYPDQELYINDDAMFLDADFIFHTAGTPNIHGESRLSTVEQNVKISEEIFADKKFTKTPYIIAISNPVDVIAYFVSKFTKLPEEHVIGTGTFLDSMRLAYYLSSISNYEAKDFDAIVLGEHGSSQVPIYSKTKIQGNPILDNSEFTSKKLDHAAELTENAAFKIRETQVGTSYGVAKCAETVFNYMVGEKEHFLTLSMLTNEHYRNLLHLKKDIYISMPVQIKNGKIEIRNDIDFTKEELAAYRKSAAILAEISN
jgi:L-lactate dehydrogenase